MELVERFVAAQRVFAERVHAVRPDQWGLPTPNDDWTVADLVAHVIDEQRWAVPLLDGLDPDAGAKVVDAVAESAAEAGLELPAAWDDAAAASADAVCREGAMERWVDLVRGPTPATGYLTELIFDLVVHAWDLCRAVGYGVRLPDAVVEPVWAEMKVFGDLSASGLFDRPVEVPDDVPTIDRLVAMTGRDPR